VAGVPDVNGDGRGDMLVGAESEDVGSVTSAGQAHLFSGATGAPLYTLESPDPNHVGYFGHAVVGLGDVDGDGRGDLLIGAPYETTDPELSEAGRAYVFSGASGALLRTLASPNGEDRGFFGYTVSAVPDADGDGAPDLLIGALLEDPGASPTDAGRAYLVSGSSGAVLATLASPGEQLAGQFGRAVAGVPDADGDGRGDLLVGAPFEDRSGISDGGNVYLFSGALGSAAAVVPEIEPVGSTVIPASGGPLRYRVTLTNTTAQAQRFDAWIIAVLPGGDEYGPVRGPQAVTLGPNQTLGPIPFTEQVPGQAPAGTYSLVLRVGDFPGDVDAADAFPFSKQPAAGAPSREAVAAGGEEHAAASGTGGPVAFTLHPAYPNPFATSTTVRYDLARATPVRLAVYDPLGREVTLLIDGEQAGGRHEAILNGRALPSGVYLVRLTAGAFVQTQRVALVR
jgi:hypothetical protein